MDTEIENRKARVSEICLSFPETTSEPFGEPHRVFKVRGKTFVYYMERHHANDIIGLWIKSTKPERDIFLNTDEPRFFHPPYVGVHGWIGLRLDTAEVHWDEVRDLIERAYVLSAPKKLVAVMKKPS